MSEFDTPLFKVLAHNDTGQATGHQGGIVIPKDLESWFPQLSRRATATEPTQQEFIIADLFDGARFLETVATRYQYQTWGGTRPPERRLTANLSPIRNLAHAGDLLLIERGITDDKRYRLTLLRQGTAQFAAAAIGLGSRRWGPLLVNIPPVKEVEVEAAAERIAESETQNFSLFDADAGITESRSVRIARSRAFQTHLAQLYGRMCSVCDQGLRHPNGRSETEAAHIVPRRLRGSDDARNGLLLCRAHHWAFDAGLFGISPAYEITVPASVSTMTENLSLIALQGKAVKLPTEATLAPHPEALKWHSQNIVLQH